MADPVEAAVARLADEDRRRLHDAIAQWHDDVTITSFGTAREANTYAAGAQEVLRQLTVKLDGKTCSCPTDDDSPLDGFLRLSCPLQRPDETTRREDDAAMNDAQLTDIARTIFHSGGDELVMGEALQPVPEADLPRLSEILQGMQACTIAYRDQTAAMIAEHGWMVQAVMAGNDSPWFAYTVGLWPGLPAEFIVRGFGQQTYGVVYTVKEWLDAGTMQLVPGIYTVNENGFRVRVDPWRGDPGDFGMAIRHHGHRDFPMVHVVCSDDEYRLPGEPGCTVVEHQMMGLPA